jgi:hypothetical protein
MRHERGNLHTNASLLGVLRENRRNPLCCYCETDLLSVAEGVSPGPSAYGKCAHPETNVARIAGLDR